MADSRQFILMDWLIAFQVFSVNNFGAGLPGIKTYKAPNGSLANIVQYYSMELALGPAVPLGRPSAILM